MEWQFNGAVGIWGRYVENKIQETDDKGHQLYPLQVVLGVAEILSEDLLPDSDTPLIKEL